MGQKSTLGLDYSVDKERYNCFGDICLSNIGPSFSKLKISANTNPILS